MLRMSPVLLIGMLSLPLAGCTESERSRPADAGLPADEEVVAGQQEPGADSTSDQDAAPESLGEPSPDATAQAESTDGSTVESAVEITVESTVDTDADQARPDADGPPAEAAENAVAEPVGDDEASPGDSPQQTVATAAAEPEEMQITKQWPQWGGTSARNNVPVGQGIPRQWDIGQFDRDTGNWIPGSGENIKWVAQLGSQSYGNPVVADGKVFVGTNNSAGWLERYPASVDLGCLLAFDRQTGKFLWQHSSEKLPTGRVHDWPLQGICCAPLVEGNRLWFVTSRGEVCCLDTEGFYDDENDGEFQQEPVVSADEADVVWSFDMMRELNVSQHNMCSCSVTSAGDLLFVNTSNGVDQSHVKLPAPEAPSFICLDKNSGEVLWTDASPGTNILHGQWSSPTYGVLGGVPQVIFGGGDGWVYSFRADKGQDGHPELLWTFDANPKESRWELGGRGTRNNIIGTPVIYNDLVYIGVGQDPEHGEGMGHLWCIDPTKRGDVSPELAFHVSDLETPLPHRRIQAVIPENNEVARPNPNSAAVWHYSEYDTNSDGEIDDFYETLHRTCGTVAIKNDVLFIADFSGLFHCLDAKTGRPYWTYDMLAAAWGSPLIVEDTVYVGDEDGDISVFRLSSDPEVAMQHDGGEMVPLQEINMANSVYSTPVVADNVLYIANRTHLFAIAPTDDQQATEVTRAAQVP